MAHLGREIFGGTTDCDYWGWDHGDVGGLVFAEADAGGGGKSL